VTAITATLARASTVLAERIRQLEARLLAGEDVAAEYNDAVRTLAAVAPATAPGADGRLVRTRELAESLGISTRTVRRMRKRGELAPAATIGQGPRPALRWRTHAAGAVR
jgi:hypothetical protein